MPRASAEQSSDIEIREVTAIEEYNACVLLQREVFGLPDLEISPRRHLIVSHQAGGWTLGAFVEGKLVGFVHHLAAVSGDQIFGYSHMMAVTTEFQNRGLGARLKWAQRARALAEGRNFIKWTFEPTRARNAYFNLNRLGAICRRYLPNLYGITTSPLHRGLATDRLVAEWYLDSPRVLAALNGELAEPPCASSIEIPSGLEDWKASDLPRVQSIQAAIRDQFSDGFAKGYATVAVFRTSQGSAYILAPWSEF